MLKKRLKNILASFIMTAHADNGSFMNTVANDGSTTPPNSPLSNGDTAVLLTNNVRTIYSREIQFQAMPLMVFMGFAKQKTELVSQPGVTISMMTYNNLKRGGKLTEGNRMKTQALSNTMKSITVTEWGNATSVSELALKASFTDVMEDATTLLTRDYALTMDLALRDTALSVTNVIYGRKDGAAKIAARANITADNPLSVATIKDGVEILSTNNVPKIDGQYYVCIVHPHQSRTLRDDPRWLDVAKYASPENLLTGEIGKIDDVRFLETAVMPNGAAPVDDDSYKAALVKGAVGGSADVPVYQAILFGDELYGFAEGLPVELRDDGVTDFGREHSLAWYSIAGMDLLNPERGVKIETC